MNHPRSLIRTLPRRAVLPFLTALLVALAAPAASAGGYKFKTKEGCGVAHYRKAWAEPNIKAMSWTGKCKSGLTQGKGVLTVQLQDGRSERYDGKMNKGYFGGSAHDNHGEYLDADGVKRIGDFLNNRLYSGQVINADGSVLYDGTFNFKDGHYDHGKLYWEDGGYIEATFEPDGTSVARSGQGILYGEVKDKDGKTLAYYFRGQQVADAAALQNAIAGLEQELAAQRARDQAVAEAQAAADQAQRDADEAAAYQQLGQVLGAYAATMQGQQRAPVYTPPAAYQAPQPTYTPPVYQAPQPSYTPQPTYSPPAYTPPQPSYTPAPAPQGPQHDPNLVASNCIRLVDGPNGHVDFQNGCGYSVELTWCVVGVDCNPGYSNTWTIGAGATWPVRGSELGYRQVFWGACRGANTLHATSGEAANKEFRCY